MRIILTSIVANFILGFICWTCWQIAVITAPALGLVSIPLSAGLALWFLWFIVTFVPLYSAGAELVQKLNITFKFPMDNQKKSAPPLDNQN